MKQLNDANRAQFAASNPSHSSFVSANAGSGKTTVLTQRIARLLLRGVNPSRILCVTFTKAAAGEVQNRVFDSLAKWVLKNDDELRKELRGIGEDGDLPPDMLKDARRLFAQALETPGGLKIETIHAFSASVLRRFPLEAGVSPNFQEMSELDQYELLKTCLNDIAKEMPKELAHWKSLLPIEDYKSLLNVISHCDASLSADEIAKKFESKPLKSAEELIAEFNRIYSDDTKSNFHKQILPPSFIEKWLEFKKIVEDGDLEAAMDALRAVYLTQTLTLNSHVEKRIAKQDNAAQLYAYINFVADLIDQNNARKFYELQAEFNKFGKLLSQKYRAQKDMRGWLDYEDLIEYCQDLLNQNHRLNWVMYRLDGGIEHILVDEAQDTNDSQWKIVDALAKQLPEAGNLDKTLFVVGDEKQSIFGFQGANPDIFLAKRDEYKADLALHQKRFHIGDMVTSFRSSPLILKFVDAVFSGPLGEGLGGSIRHLAHDQSMPGKIEVWPLYVRDAVDKVKLWPTGLIAPKTNAEIELAHDIAKMISDDLKTGKQIFVDGEWRAVRPGDYLVLTRSRKKIYTPLQKELQRLGVPIAGVDRMKLSEQLAVKDIMALLRFAQSPFDEFSLACFLKSPLCGLDDNDIFSLMGGGKTLSLFKALKESKNQYKEANEMLEFVMALVDYKRPYDIISQFLLKYNGVEKLQARLGSAVGDAIENLLDQALNFESQEAPSLAGFLRWFDQQDVDVKRELENTDDALRVMTIHGAKGLEAPIVIAALAEGRDISGSSMKIVDGTAIYSKKSSATHARTAAMQKIEKERAAKDIEEIRRLLYVAFTRAQTRLVICGVISKKSDGEDADPIKLIDIYDHLQSGIAAIGGAVLKTIEQGDVLQHSMNFIEDHTEPSAAMKGRQNFELDALPSRETGAEAKSVSSLLANYEAKETDHARGAEFGDLVHHLIEHWPAAVQFGDMAVFFASMNNQPNFDEAFNEVSNTYKKFPELLQAVHEVEFSAPIFGHEQVNGRIDAIIDDGQYIRIIDFKTETEMADCFSDLPLRYQQQLAIYQHIIADLYPEKVVSAEIIWTFGAKQLLAPLAELERIFVELS